MRVRGEGCVIGGYGGWKRIGWLTEPWGSIDDRIHVRL